MEENKVQGGRKVPPQLLATGLLGKAIRKRWLRSSPQYSPARGKRQLQTKHREPAQVQPSTSGSSPPSERCATPGTLNFALPASKSSRCRYLGQQLIFETPGPILTHLSRAVKMSFLHCCVHSAACSPAFAWISKCNLFRHDPRRRPTSAETQQLLSI